MTTNALQLFLQAYEAEEDHMYHLQLLDLVEQHGGEELKSFVKYQTDRVGEVWATSMKALARDLSLKVKTRIEGYCVVSVYPSIRDFILVGSNGDLLDPYEFLGESCEDCQEDVNIEYRGSPAR